MAKRKKKKDLTLELARELFRYENGKLYWKSKIKFSPNSIGDRVGSSFIMIPIFFLNNKKYYIHRTIYLLHHGYCPMKVDFKNKTLTDEGIYDTSIENLFEPSKREGIRKSKKKSYREEVSYFEVNDYLEYKNGRLYWKAKPYPNSCVVVGNLAGGTSGTSFLRVKLHGKIYGQHRIVYLLHHRYCPQIVTFINKTLTDEGFYDISIENLKASTHSHERSVTNYPKRRKSSKYRGVHLDSASKKYKVLFIANRVFQYGGHFENEEEAARKYDAMAKQLIGEDAVLNFPEEKHLSTSIS
jgi:hypothetical protein